jgi:predicted secreted protein
MIKVGCQTHTIEYWRRHAHEIAKKENAEGIPIDLLLHHFAA